MAGLPSRLRVCGFAFEVACGALAPSVPVLEAFCACSTPLTAKVSEPSARPEMAIRARAAPAAPGGALLLCAFLVALREVLRLIEIPLLELECEFCGQASGNGRGTAPRALLNG